jgi:hypothetical protein
MRVATAMLTGFFVIAGGTIPSPLARVHPPAMDVTKPEKPHYVLLRRKPEPDQNLVLLNSILTFGMTACWECRPKSAPLVYPSWSAWPNSKRITLTAEEQRR